MIEFAVETGKGCDLDIFGGKLLWKEVRTVLIEEVGWFFLLILFRQKPAPRLSSGTANIDDAE
ncbi:hypothetical protein [Microbulbifer sp. TRSA005]|uniref:hypothetical protein n=1 Tax=unclassified Microbulbifer TaxID=2619833 RepID=UPI004039621F